ncbi:MAG TPA: hypothetical protein PLI09_02790 [Candidatus Hydrogenedentes bacterium]|nr:hypothetical protein [Candidatus Hydrogenedentota bacterium]
MHIRDLKNEWPVNDEEWFWEKPTERKDGNTEVEILNEAGFCDLCHFHCVWNSNTNRWVCEKAEHTYYEALHLGQEVVEDCNTRDLDEHFGELIRAAFSISSGKISGAAVLGTSPAALRKLSPHP